MAKVTLGGKSTIRPDTAAPANHETVYPAPGDSSAGYKRTFTTAAREQTAKPITQVNCLEAQRRPLPRMNEELSSRPVASQVGLTQDHQQASEETLEPVTPQPGSPTHNNQYFRGLAVANIQSEQDALRSEFVPPNASPNSHVADATQQDTVAERPSLSPPRESSTQSDVRTRMDIASSEKLTKEQDRSPGRGEGASNAAKRSAVTIMFRARESAS